MIHSGLNRKTLECDFCVIGGGLSGFCAAIAAAREGASVVLVHDRPVLGGNASSEIRMCIGGIRDMRYREGGLMEELFLENAARNPYCRYPFWDIVLYDMVVREQITGQSRRVTVGSRRQNDTTSTHLSHSFLSLTASYIVT